MATGYITVAERTPTKEEFPDAPPENLVAGSVVFTPPLNPVPLNDHFQWWTYVKGANWRYPEGPQSDIKGKENYPVVQVAYEDALAYAKWAGKRLPTEAEWEFAARGGLACKTHAWGDEFKPGGKFMANTYQGQFPVKDIGQDGFAGIAPVKSFAPNGYGLYDMAGNVWQWCSDWYRSDYFQQLAAAGGVARNPQGPANSFDPAEPGVRKRVQKGGSFLCSDQYCTRYIVGTRGKSEPSTATQSCRLPLREKRELTRSLHPTHNMKRTFCIHIAVLLTGLQVISPIMAASPSPTSSPSRESTHEAAMARGSGKNVAPAEQDDVPPRRSVRSSPPSEISHATRSFAPKRLSNWCPAKIPMPGGLSWSPTVGRWGLMEKLA